MKAFVLEKHGSPFREVQMPEPVPGPGEVLVRVAAAGVNHADERSRAGEFKALFSPTLPAVAGGELAGEVVALGPDVAGVAVGDAVYAYTGVVRMGVWAELAVVEAAALAPAPRSVSPTEAAALPVVGLTAWQALVTLGRVQPGQRVLIHGGSVAVQLARHLGATVIATVSGRNAEFVRGLGRHEVVDYRTEDFVARLTGSPVDLVLDTQGGETTSRSFEVVRPGGLVVGIAGTPDPGLADQAGAPRHVKLALTALSARLRRQAARRNVRYRFLFIEPDGAALRTLAGLVDDGVVRPVVDRVVPFADTLSALDQVLAGGTRGKVLVSMDPTEGPWRPERARTWATAPTRHVEVDGELLAWRELGRTDGVPVVLLTHLAATQDEWDPRVVDALAQRHRVVALELEGVGGSTGTVPDTVQEMADTARAMLRELGIERADVVGFSLGGFVAQQIALDAPELVRRLVLAGTGPAGGEGIDRSTGGAYVYTDMLRGALARTDAKEFLFFPRTAEGKAAARDYLARLRERVMDRDERATLEVLRRQIAAIRRWGRQEPQDLSRITAPTLIANGDDDRMVPSILSEDMQRRIPDSTLVIYPDSGHGGVFQHHEEFTRAMLEHLAG